MTINIIHDTRHPEKLSNTFGELARQGYTDYKVWNAVEDSNSVVASISKSHKQIVQWAKDNNQREVFIIEDDCQFPAKDGLDYFIRKKPTSFWRLYLGGSYALKTVEISGVNFVTHFWGMHCYIMNESLYSFFLGAPDHLHIDSWLSDMIAKYEIATICCYPMAAIQRMGWSANNMENVNYNTILTDEDVYGGLPK